MKKRTGSLLSIDFTYQSIVFPSPKPTPAPRPSPKPTPMTPSPTPGGKCPGGTLQKCMDLCPSSPPDAYQKIPTEKSRNLIQKIIFFLEKKNCINIADQKCVASCAANCPNGPPTPFPKPTPVPRPSPKPTSPSKCPGGTLQKCMDQCPSSPPDAYQKARQLMSNSL